LHPAGTPPLFEIDLNLTDSQAHTLNFYFLDWDQAGRSQRVEILDPASGAILDARDINAFANGTWVTWKIKGNIRARILSAGGPNAVLSGIFLE
jgi:hypothetical protein